MLHKSSRSSSPDDHLQAPHVLGALIQSAPHGSAALRALVVLLLACNPASEFNLSTARVGPMAKPSGSSSQSSVVNARKGSLHLPVISAGVGDRLKQWPGRSLMQVSGDLDNGEMSDQRTRGIAALSDPDEDGLSKPTAGPEHIIHFAETNISDDNDTHIVLLTSESSPIVFAGSNASLFAVYLNQNSTNFSSEILPANSSSTQARLTELWQSGRLLVGDREIWSKADPSREALVTHATDASRRAKLVWSNMPKDAAIAYAWCEDHCPLLLTAVKSASNTTETLAALKELLVFFRENYPYYHNECDRCGGRSDWLGEVYPIAEEDQNYNASRKEHYCCIDPACRYVTIFTRYNNVGRTFHYRKGRCGEYSAVFLAILNGMGFRSRYVVDVKGDHLWNEVYLDDHWYHVDPCEASINEPRIYEGWGKNGTLVVAFPDKEDPPVDVTDVYYDREAVARWRNESGVSDNDLKNASKAAGIPV